MKTNRFAFLIITTVCFLTGGALCNGLYGDGNTAYSELVAHLDLDASDENDQPSTPILSPGEYVIAFGKKEDGYKYTASSGWPATNMAKFQGWQIHFSYKIGDGDWIPYRSPGTPPNNWGVYATEMEAYNSYTPISLRLDRAEALTFKVGDSPGHYSVNRGGRSILVYRVSENPFDFSNGLIAHYPFDGNANDMSGNGNDGAVNGATLGTDRHGVPDKAYSFDGVDDHISLNANIGNFGTSDFTMSAWLMKLDLITDGAVIGKRNDSVEPGMLVFASSPGYEISTSGGDYTVSTASRYQTTNRWFHLIFKRSGNNLQLYLDNQLIDSVVTPSVHNFSNSAVTLIGARYSQGSIWHLWHGQIDEVRIYNRALSATEIAALYELERPKDSDSDGLYDAYEIYITTDPNDNDTDEDGLLDGEEVHIGTNPKSSDATLVNFFNAKAETRETNARTNALVEGEATGIATVKADPSAHNLVTKDAYDQMVEQLINSSESGSTTPFVHGWFYYPSRGWMWTNRTSYPYFYDSSTKSWMYFKSGEDKPRFYHYGTKTWVTLGE